MCGGGGGSEGRPGEGGGRRGRAQFHKPATEMLPFHINTTVVDKACNLQIRKCGTDGVLLFKT